MIVCSLRVSSHLEGSSTPEIRTSTTHELMSPAALHKGHHHKEVRIGRYRCLHRIGMPQSRLQLQS
jgi:hypothetical protein